MRAIVPDDYDEMLAYYTCKGYRVIGCATRHLRKMSWVKSQKMDRTAIERELHFTGFIIFENKLKHSTTAVLKELSQAKIGSIMVTGDNILTAVSVARDCGLVNPLAHCFIPRFTQGCRQGADARLEWESLDDPDFKLDNDSLLVRLGWEHLLLFLLPLLCCLLLTLIIHSHFHKIRCWIRHYLTRWRRPGTTV
jgi:cation-transporting ATPase 13A3/4/5